MTLHRLIAAPLVVAALLAPDIAAAQDNPLREAPDVTRDVTDAGEISRSAAVSLVEDAVAVAQRMKQDDAIARLMSRATAVLIVPDLFARGVPGRGQDGIGVMLSRSGDRWSSPAFFDIGSVDADIRSGAGRDSAAMLLMTAEALDIFRNELLYGVREDFHIVAHDADAARREDGDAIVWAEKDSGFVAAMLTASRIRAAADWNRAYYPGTVTVQAILGLDVVDPQGGVLARAMP